MPRGRLKCHLFSDLALTRVPYRWSERWESARGSEKKSGSLAGIHLATIWQRRAVAASRTTA